MRSINRRETLAILAAGAVLPGASARAFSGPQMLQEAVAAGELPTVEGRLPKMPRVVDVSELGGTPGQHGGELRILIGRQRDVRLIPIFGYSRLIGFDRDLNFVADILESFEVEDQRVFTFKLREGHRWSDGHPFTAEDLRYAWEDVILHPKLPGLSLIHISEPTRPY